MHLIEPIRSCIDDVIKAAGSGMKAMVLDDFTTGVVGAAFNRSEMFLREIYLFEYIDSIFESSERLNTLKCIVLLRPTKSNIDLLCRELTHPHYRTYYIYFSGKIGSQLTKKLAEADEREVVRELKELPLDFAPICPFIYHLNLKNKTYDLRSDDWFPEGLKRSSDGLTSLLISLQFNPIIRYQTQSLMCKSLAEIVSSNIRSEWITNDDFKANAPHDIDNLLIILDRRLDLISPLIHSWYYCSMIHDEFNIVNNRINLENLPGRLPKDPKEMILSMEHDHFYRDNYFKNFGELGPTLLSAVEELKVHTKSHHKVETLADMKRFIDEYPETKRYANDLHNHVFLMTEIGKIVNEFNLVSVSECEQELACDITSHSDLVKKISQIICSSKIRAQDATRLVCLYSLCHQDKSSLKTLIKLLKTRVDVAPDDLKSVDYLREFRLSQPQNPLDATVQRVAKKIVKGVKGVDNVLTEFCPNLQDILNDILKGNKLKESRFAFAGQRLIEGIPKRIIVYIVGGITYDEALVVDQFNRSGSCKIIIGGDLVHNYRTFMEEVQHSVARIQV